MAVAVEERGQNSGWTQLSWNKGWVILGYANSLYQGKVNFLLSSGQVTVL